MQSRAPWNRERAEEIIEAHRSLAGAALPILHALQREFGHIDREAVPLIASALNLSRAEVHGVLSFYHDFRDTPPGHHVLKLCRAEACQSMGADGLADAARERLRLRWVKPARMAVSRWSRCFASGCVPVHRQRCFMELYISDHPLNCLTCAANGNCELQDMAGAVGLRDVRSGYAGKNHLGQDKDISNPYFTFDPSKCIVCSPACALARKSRVPSP